MLKQYQKPTSEILFAKTEDILTLSLNATVYAVGDDPNTFGFENGDLWVPNSNS